MKTLKKIWKIGILKKCLIKSNYFFKIAKIIIRDTRAKRPFSPNKFITSEKLIKTFPKTGVSDPKISPTKRDIAMKRPRISVDLYKNFLIFKFKYIHILLN